MNESIGARTGWFVSIGFHILLALLFFLMKLELQPFDLDFTPVFFFPVSETETGGGSADATLGGAQPLVELPRRPMLNETSPLLKLPDSDRQAVIAPSPKGKPDLSSMESIRPGMKSDILPGLIGQRERAPVRAIPLSDEALFGERTDLLGEKIAGDEMFEISWKGPTRTKISGELPRFPGGLNEAVTVRLSFTVAPDGSVVAVDPLVKGMAELEKVSIEALRSWRFNALESSIVQENQDGVITFVFELK